jgi:hypothetical protein
LEIAPVTARTDGETRSEITVLVSGPRPGSTSRTCSRTTGIAADRCRSAARPMAVFQPCGTHWTLCSYAIQAMHPGLGEAATLGAIGKGLPNRVTTREIKKEAKGASGSHRATRPAPLRGAAP